MKTFSKPLVVFGAIGMVALFVVIGFVQSLMTGGKEQSEERAYADGEIVRPLTGDPLTTPAWEVYRPKVLPTDPVWGSETAVVDIIEYGDFECPYCKSVQETLAAVKERYGDVVRIVWKDFPNPLHPEAMAAAIAARCAGLQGKFWEYHDYLFANQDQLDTALYRALAAEIQLDEEDFAACIETKATVELIGANMDEAQLMEVDGTPHFLINGRRLDFAGSFAQFQALIEEALQEKH